MAELRSCGIGLLESLKRRLRLSLKRSYDKGQTTPRKSLRNFLQCGNSSENCTRRRELRTIVRVYNQRLEHELLASTKALRRYQPAEKLSREQLHCIRDFAIMVRQRRFRPEKGRRKDLRKIDSLISELRPLTDERRLCNLTVTFVT